MKNLLFLNRKYVLFSSNQNVLFQRSIIMLKFVYGMRSCCDYELPTTLMQGFRISNLIDFWAVARLLLPTQGLHE